jgi:hypothetical protein
LKYQLKKVWICWQEWTEQAVGSNIKSIWVLTNYFCIIVYGILELPSIVDNQGSKYRYTCKLWGEAVQSRNICKASSNFVSHKNNRPNNKQQQFTYRGARQQTTNSRLLKTQKKKNIGVNRWQREVIAEETQMRERCIPWRRKHRQREVMSRSRCCWKNESQTQIKIHAWEGVVIK